jgi:hypothetical protein
METLTCPACKNREKTPFFLRFGDDHAVKCPACNHPHTLGQARQRGKISTQPFLDDEDIERFRANHASKPTTEQPISNGIAAILSLLIPGVGQLCQNRNLAGFLFLIVGLAGWCLFAPLGLAVHVIACIEAAQH